MDISLLHAGLAAGAGLAAVPVIIHLMMKQKPRRVIFPALRLIQERHKRSRKKLRIKNWLLLAARMLLIVLMALALARPTLHSEVSLGDQEVPTALALVFDTSQSMEYTERGKDRLAEAKARAEEILKKTTDDSEVFVVDSARPYKPDPMTPAAARKRVEALRITPANRTLDEAVAQANAAVAASNLARREIYVLTDLARSAWDLSSTKTAEAQAKQRKNKVAVGTYVLQLTPKDVRNVAVVAAEASPTGGDGDPAEVRATVRSAGPKGSRVVELWLDGVKRDQKTVELPANGEVDTTLLTPPKLTPGVHQGVVKLGGGAPDNMPFDDSRFFSFTLQPTVSVLIVADLPRDPARPGDDDAIFVQQALAPEGSSALFRVTRETTRQFQARARLAAREFAAIFLLNVERPAAEDWAKLRAYVADGGGLVVAPGSRSRADAYAQPTALAVMPAPLDAVKAPAGGTTFGKAEFSHPLFSRHPRLLDSELTQVPVRRYWGLKPAVEGARVLLRYADGAPAVLERAFRGPRAGHVLLWTTPLARRADPADPAAWNDFPQSWSFLGVLLDAVPYLAGTGEAKLNYEAGQDVVLALDPAKRSANYVVQGPDPKVTDRVAPAAGADALVIQAPPTLGQWTVEGKATDGSPVAMGFSINAPPAESQVVAIKPGELDPVFGGSEHYKVADSAEGLRRAQDMGRVGTEVFPILMILILALVTAENVLANKFHRETAVAA